MNSCLLSLALTLGCAPATGPDPQPVTAVDRWIAEDKLRHFTLSFAATQMTYGGARALMEPASAVPTAAGVALALGLAKEMADIRAGTPFSLKDLAWDAAGVALGTILIRTIH